MLLHMLITTAVGMIMLSTAACYGIHIAVGHPTTTIMIIMLLVLAVMMGRPYIITTFIVPPATANSPILIIIATMVGRLRFETAIVTTRLGHTGSGCRSCCC